MTRQADAASSLDDQRSLEPTAPGVQAKSPNNSGAVPEKNQLRAAASDAASMSGDGGNTPEHIEQQIEWLEKVAAKRKSDAARVNGLQMHGRLVALGAWWATTDRGTQMVVPAEAVEKLLREMDERVES